jgi:Mg-chelatase subunit ChlD
MQMILNDYPRNDSSSSAEHTQFAAARALAPRSGTKAIVMVTDAATPQHRPMWDMYKAVLPRVFIMKVSSGTTNALGAATEEDLGQDWSRVNGGHYTYLDHEGDMEVAFDRAATMLRRPANYTLTMQTEFREAPGPGTLRVVAGTESSSASSAVELILDASGSMWKKLDGRFRIDVAKEVLTTALNKYIPPETPVALRVFGHRKANACDTNLEIALQPLNVDQATATLAGVSPQSLAKTPIAASLAAVSRDLRGNKGAAVVVLVTDGEETCDGDPAAEIERLEKAGFQMNLNIVGFAIDDDALAAQFETWAEAGGGRYFAANDADGLNDAVAQALATPYKVFDQSGEAVAEGVVGGDPVELEQGVYRVVVSGTPSQEFKDVSVTGAKETGLEL